jgi:hypothetical protein
VRVILHDLYDRIDIGTRIVVLPAAATLRQSTRRPTRRDGPRPPSIDRKLHPGPQWR